MLISVIIPAYNAEKTILATIKSVVLQSYQDIEIIVIDDGSTDNTVAIISALNEPKIKLFSFENEGLPTARNRGIKHSSGELLSFLDADDIWTADKLEKQFNKLQGDQDIGVVYSWTRFIDEENQILYSGLGLNEVLEGDIYPEMLKRNFIRSGSNILMRKDLVNKAGYFDPALKSVEDWDYYIRLASLTKFSCVPEYQILYRKSEKSMTTNVEKMELFSILVVDRAYKNAPQRYQHLKKVSLSNIYFYLSKQFLSYDPFDTSIGLVLRAFKKLAKAIYYNPKIFLNQEFLKSTLKMVLIGFAPKWLSKNIWNFATSLFSKNKFSSETN